jgi:anti-sigma B factor antagonist
MKSAPPGRQHDLTSEVPLTLEVEMPDAQVFPDSIAGSAGDLPPALVCSWTDGGLDAAWVHVAGELTVATLPQLDRTLREPGVQARLVVLDLRELEFMDSSGAHALVSHVVRARKAGRRLVLLRGPAVVDRMLTLAACADDLEIGDIEHVESAVAGLLQFSDEEPVL